MKPKMCSEKQRMTMGFSACLMLYGMTHRVHKKVCICGVIACLKAQKKKFQFNGDIFNQACSKLPIVGSIILDFQVEEKFANELYQQDLIFSTSRTAYFPFQET